MAHEKLITLINLLHEKTRNETMDWKETEDEDSFEAAFPNFTVMISADTSHRFSKKTEYSLLIYDAQARLIEEVSDEELSIHELGTDPTYFMKEIHQGARMKALGVNKALDEIITEIKNKT